MLIVDAANVVGSRPDGWWRDRAGAADRLIAQIEAAIGAGRLAGEVVVVLEGRANRAGADPDSRGGILTVVRAPASGDDRIVELAAAATADGEGVRVATADRGLIGRLQALGAEIERPKRLLQLLVPSD